MYCSWLKNTITMKLPGLGIVVITILLSRITQASSAFRFEWMTTVEAPQTPKEPTALEKEHIQAVDDQAITIAGESVDIYVLANDVIHSSDKSSLSLSLERRGRNGYCVIHDDTDFVIYYPKHRYAGYDECEYTVCDQDGFCDSAKVTVTIVKATEANADSSSSNPDRPAVPETTGNITGENDQVYHSNDVALDFFSCPEGQASLIIEVQADKYGEDTTWTLRRELEDGSVETELAGGPYDSNGFDSKHVCAPKPSRWNFTIHDAFGDGKWNDLNLFLVCLADGI